VAVVLLFASALRPFDKETVTEILPKQHDENISAFDQL
jgi:hypothetical protein